MKYTDEEKHSILLNVMDEVYNALSSQEKQHVDKFKNELSTLYDERIMNIEKNY